MSRKTPAQLDREIAEALARPSHSTTKIEGPTIDTTAAFVEFLADNGIERGGRGAATGAIRLFDATAFVKERTLPDGSVDITVSHQSSRGTSRQRFRSRERALADLRRQIELNRRLAR